MSQGTSLLHKLIAVLVSVALATSFISFASVPAALGAQEPEAPEVAAESAAANLETANLAEATLEATPDVVEASTQAENVADPTTNEEAVVTTEETPSAELLAAGDTIDVALTIVDASGTTVSAVYNAGVKVVEPATVAGLLQAAGFTEGPEADCKTGSKVYTVDATDSNKLIGVAGLLQDPSADTPKVWSYSSTDTGVTVTDLASAVEVGKHYVLVYGAADYAFAYDTTIKDPFQKNVYDAEFVSKLTENLANRFKTGGKDANIPVSTAGSAKTASTDYAAYGLYHLNFAGDVDSDAIIANYKAARAANPDGMSAGLIARYILALTASDMDAAEIDEDGNSLVDPENHHDLIAEMEKAMKDDESLYDLVWILPVYLNYTMEDTDENEAMLTKLISQMLSYWKDAAIIDSGMGPDYQTTAQAVLALAPYYDNTNFTADGKLKNTLDAACAAFAEAVNYDGGIAGLFSEGASDVDATAAVVTALVAMGKNPVAYTNAVTGSDLLGYLVEQADATLDGYKAVSQYDEPMTAATVLEALGVYKEMQEKVVNGSSYAEAAVNALDFVPEVNPTPNKNTNTNTAKSTTAATGDANFPLFMTFGILAVCSAVALFFAFRSRSRDKVNR